MDYITEGLMLYEEEALSHVEKEKNNIRCRILKDYSSHCYILPTLAVYRLTKE